MTQLKTFTASLAVVIGLTSTVYAESNVERDIAYCREYADLMVGKPSSRIDEYAVTGIDVLSSVLDGRDPSYRVRSEIRQMRREERADNRMRERMFERCMRDRSE